MKIRKPRLTGTLFEDFQILVRIIINKALPIFQRYPIQISVGYIHSYNSFVTKGAVFLSLTTQTIAIGTTQFIGHISSSSCVFNAKDNEIYNAADFTLFL